MRLVVTEVPEIALLFLNRDSSFEKKQLEPKLSF